MSFLRTSFKNSKKLTPLRRIKMRKKKWKVLTLKTMRRILIKKFLNSRINISYTMKVYAKWTKSWDGSFSMLLKINLFSLKIVSLSYFVGWIFRKMS